LSAHRHLSAITSENPKGGGLQINLIDVAPLPVLPALCGLNQRMLRSVEMRTRMTVRRRVAAAHMPALQAHPQMHPRIAALQTLLASLRLRLYLLQVLCDMCTFSSHLDLQKLVFISRYLLEMPGAPHFDSEMWETTETILHITL
jgi:hypothetical protein